MWSQTKINYWVADDNKAEMNTQGNAYLSRFLAYRCSGDVLNAVHPLRDAAKEITESMAIITRLKSIVLPEKMKYTVFDLCAGNALTSIMAVHMLPILSATAVDKKKRERAGHANVKRFSYLEADINNIGFDYIDDCILISVHPCKTAELVIQIFNEQINAKHLIMMPCCNGEYLKDVGHGWLHEKKRVSVYDLWTLKLANQIKNSEVKIVTDEHVLSPKNNIIVAHKEGGEE